VKNPTAQASEPLSALTARETPDRRHGRRRGRRYGGGAEPGLDVKHDLSFSVRRSRRTTPG